MTKQEAKVKIKKYLDSEHIEYRMLNDTDGIVSLERIDTIYLSCSIEDVIGRRIETTLRFEEDRLYCQSYYSRPVADTEEKAIKAARMCNYMNLHLPWDCNCLFEHNYFINEEDGDIFNGCLIRYELMEAYFQETMDHILNFSVQQIADVCIPVIFHLTGKYTYEDFKDYLKTRIIGK